MASACSLADAQRLETLRSYQILDTEPEPSFDDVARLAATICQAPIALMGFFDADRHWFKASYGVELQQLTLEDSLCARALGCEQAVVVSDVLGDARLADICLVKREPQVRFYAGAQIHSPHGHLLGSLCVMDVQPRELNPGQLDALQALGRLVGSRLELRRGQLALQQETRTLSTLARAGKALAAELDLDRLLQTITDLTTEATGAKFGAFFYNAIDDRGEAYQLYTLSGASMKDFANFPMPRKTAVFAPTFDGSGVVRSDDITQDPRYGKNTPYQGMPKGHLPVRSYLAAPVVSRSGEVLGGLFLAHPEPGVFTELAERLAAGIAGQAAVAIDNARLYQLANRELAERRRTEEALRASEREYRFLAESIPQLVWTLRADGGVEYINDRWREYAGFSGEKILDWQWQSYVHPDDSEPMADVIRHSVATGEPLAAELRIRRHDGQYRWFLARAVPYRDEAGQIVRWFGTSTDVEDAKQAEQRYRTLIEAMPQLVWTATPEGQCDFLSRQWCDYTGKPMEEQLGHRWAHAIHPDDRKTVVGAWREAAETGADFDVEYRLRAADGSYRWFKTRGVPLHDEDGQILHWFGTCTDITEIVRAREASEANQERLEQLVAERTRELAETNNRLIKEMEEREKAEEALRQSQKMEAVGQLTGGVAHDFNNLLQVIRGNLQLLGRDIYAGEPAQRRLQTALSAVERGAQLASQLLAFARRQPLEPKVVNVGRLLKGMDDLLRRALGETIELETIIGGGLWNTFADPAQVENAILNLAVNARDAMSGAGNLTIETSNAMLDDYYVAKHADVTPGQYVMLAISDTGCGMPPEILERVFEPFFTTKPEGRGTGLGLSMVYGFVKQSKGHIKLYSEADQGTTVKIYLPRALQAEEVVPEVCTGPIEHGTETVLVAEDDAEVRQTVVDMLSELGYRVLKAADAQSALAILQSGIPVDLLFTDVVMPGPLRTPELARQAKQIQPDLAVLFTSGYTKNAIVHGGRLDPGVDLLSKPYSREQLARKLRHILRNREQRLALRRAATTQARDKREGEVAKRLRILLVEDDEGIRGATAELLKELGHSVLAVASAESALEAFGKGDFDVLFTDVSLPAMSGVELARRLAQQHPTLRVVVASGYGAAVSESLASLKAIILPKPYDLAELAAALDRICAADVWTPLADEPVD